MAGEVKLANLTLPCLPSQTCNPRLSPHSKGFCFKSVRLPHALMFERTGPFPPSKRFKLWVDVGPDPKPIKKRKTSSSSRRKQAAFVVPLREMDNDFRLRNADKENLEGKKWDGATRNTKIRGSQLRLRMFTLQNTTYDVYHMRRCHRLPAHHNHAWRLFTRPEAQLGTGRPRASPLAQRGSTNLFSYITFCKVQPVHTHWLGCARTRTTDPLLPSLLPL